jgi:hypothetical protein
MASNSTQVRNTLVVNQFLGLLSRYDFGGQGAWGSGGTTGVVIIKEY